MCPWETRIALAGLLVVLAKLVGMQSLLGASDWVWDQEALLREGLHLTWKRMPCANTYSYALARLDSQKVNTALAAWCVHKETRSPLRRRTEPFSSTSTRACSPSGN